MKMPIRSYANLIQIIIFVCLIGSQIACQEKELIIDSGDLRLSVNADLETFIVNNQSDSRLIISDFQASESIQLGNKKIFKFPMQSVTSESVKGALIGEKYVVVGKYDDGYSVITKTVTYSTFDSFSNLISVRVRYTNDSDHAEHLKSWSNNSYTILDQQDVPSFWAFQGSSTSARKDWVRPLESGYYDRNYMGMNSSDYGGGIPVTDVWRKDLGVAVGHLTLKPQLVSLPTEIPLGTNDVEISVTKNFAHPTVFGPGETIETLETFVMIHTGDYYNALSQYSKLMQVKGIKMLPPEEAAFESIWCGWGYGRTFTAQEILGTLSKVKEMGIKWAVLDDGFQQAEGDWNANIKKYPRGNQEITELVDQIHDMGMKAKVWWTPLAVDPHSTALKDQPEMRLFQADWSPQFITWWDAYYQSPVNSYTVAHTKKTIDLFLNEYGFDGFKMDGQHMNAVLPDHNPASELDYPEQAPEGLPEYFQMIYDDSRAIKPNAVLENCPCGTCMSFYNMPTMNQAVASDPSSLWQVRHKGKTYKALIPQTAYYSDHIEQVPFVGDYNVHFATALGVGAVPGTKFTWPKDNPDNEQGKYLLTPEKEVIWNKWFNMYDSMKLSKEEYLGGLYDIGYDKPETHVIRKNESLFYAFYSEEWDGHLTLKGLDENTTYSVRNYVTDVELGIVNASSPTLESSFKNYLLLEVSPKQ